MKVLVTGAYGGLGAHVISELSGRREVEIFAPRRVDCDFFNQESTIKYFQYVKPDLVIHLAAVVYGLKGNLDNNMRGLLDNDLINNNLFRALALYPPKFVFFSATAASYAYPYSSNLLTEDLIFKGEPHWGEYGYACAKRNAINHLKLLNDMHGVKYCYGIFTNLYGRYDRFDEDGGHVIPSLVSRAHKTSICDSSGDLLKIWGSPNTVRDFLNFKDAASAAIYLSFSNCGEAIINISSGSPITMERIGLKIASLFGLSGVSYDNSMPTGIPYRVLDNEKLKKTKFEYKINIDEGLEDLCSWYAEKYPDVRQ